MYLKICVWTDVAESLFAGTPSPASITYSGLPEDETSFGQCGGPELSIANFNYKSEFHYYEEKMFRPNKYFGYNLIEKILKMAYTYITFVQWQNFLVMPHNCSRFSSM